MLRGERNEGLKNKEIKTIFPVKPYHEQELRNITHQQHQNRPNRIMTLCLGYSSNKNFDFFFVCACVLEYMYVGTLGQKPVKEVGRGFPGNGISDSFQSSDMSPGT